MEDQVLINQFQVKHFYAVLRWIEEVRYFKEADGRATYNCSLSPQSKSKPNRMRVVLPCDFGLVHRLTTDGVKSIEKCRN